MKNLIFGVQHSVITENGNIIEGWPNGMPMLSNPLFEQFAIEAHEKIPWHFSQYGEGITGVINAFSSTIHSTLHGFYNYNPKTNVQIKEINQIEDGEKYIFPIRLIDTMLTFKIFNEVGIFLSNEVLVDLRSGRAKILFHDIYEGHGHNLGTLRVFLERQSQIHEIPMESMGFVDGNILTPKLQAIYNTKGFASVYWETHNPPLLEKDELDRLYTLLTKQKKQYHFICLNRRPRTHRIRLAAHIMHKWEKNTLFSCDRFPINTERVFENWRTYPSNSGMDYLIASGIFTKDMYLRLPVLVDQPLSINDVEIRPRLLNQAYINITTETHFYNRETCFFSEKIFKPITMLQPFILVGSYESLKILRTMGYETFSTYINEEYDNEPDPEKRLNMIITEIDRLNKLSNDDMKNLVYDLKDILIHNVLNMKKRRNHIMVETELYTELLDWVLT
jgi:hypothetical protein